MAGSTARSTLIRRALAVATALVATALTIVGGAPPANAATDTSWTPPAWVVPDNPPYLYLASSSGDYIGGGRSYLYTPDDTDLTVTSDGGRISLTVNGEEDWRATFQPPAGVGSVVAGGTYTGLTRYPFNGDEGGLSFTGEGRGCNTLAGWYVVDAVTFDGAQIETLDLRFEQRCEGTSNPPLRGQLRYDATVAPPAPPTPTHPIPAMWSPTPGAVPATGPYFYMSSQAGDWVGKGVDHLYTDGDFSLGGSGSGLNASVNTTDWWNLRFVGSNRADLLTTGFWDDLQRYPFHNEIRGGFSMSGNGAGCNRLLADVAVDELDLRSVDLTEVTFRYSQWCDGSSAALRGAVHWEPATLPGASQPPTEVAATPGGGKAVVTWAPPADGGSSARTGYEVFVYEDGNVRRAPIAVGADQTSVTVPDLEVGAPYAFKVRAMNGSGPSYRSASTGTIVPNPLGPSVTGLSPAAGPRIGGTHVVVSGSSFDGATSVTVGGTEVAFTPVSDVELELISPDLPVGDHDVVVTTAYGSSETGPQARWQARGLPPAAPSALSATPIDRGFELTWTPPPAGDAPLDGYVVTARQVGSASAALTTLAASDATSLRIEGLRPSTDFVVSISATSTWGASATTSTDAVTTPPVEVGPFASVDALVRQQYLDFLGRPPTTSEASNAALSLMLGTSDAGDLIAQLRTSDEWMELRAPIIRLYQAYFQRLPDTGGLEFWARRRARGQRLDHVSASFAASSEFLRTYGNLSNPSFVDLVYRNVLNRQPDPSGFAYWTRRLDAGLSRGTVMTQFSESSENKRVTADLVDIVLVYTGMLRRVPTVAEVEAAIDVLDGGATIADVAQRLLTDERYAVRF